MAEDDNLVPRAEAQGTRQVAQQLRRRRAKDDLVDAGVDEVGAGLVGCGVPVSRLLADGVGGTELDVAAAEIVTDGVDDGTERLAAAGVVEEDLVLLEGWELGPDGVYVEGHG